MALLSLVLSLIENCFHLKAISYYVEAGNWGTWSGMKRSKRRCTKRRHDRDTTSNGVFDYFLSFLLSIPYFLLSFSSFTMLLTVTLQLSPFLLQAMSVISSCHQSDYFPLCNRRTFFFKQVSTDLLIDELIDWFSVSYSSRFITYRLHCCAINSC